MSFCFLCVIFLFSLLLASSAILWQCIIRVMYLVRWECECSLWSESVNTIWGVNIFCEVRACEVKGLFVKSEVWGWRCEVKGLRFEVSMSSPRLDVRSWRSKVWGLYVKFEVRGQCLKCKALYLRLEVFLCKVRGQSWTKLEIWALITHFVRFKV